MKRRFTSLLMISTGLAALALGAGRVMADDDDSANASALVQLAPLHQGSLPIIVTAYGAVQPTAKAQESIPALIAVRVANVTVRVGEQIAKGTPMVTLVPSPEARASYQQAQLALRLANQLAERSRSLVKSHLQTDADLATSEKAAADAKSSLAVLQEEGAAGPSTIKAPFDAIVLKIDASAGAVVSQGSPVIEIARPNGLALQVGVVPAQALSVAANDKVSVTPLGGSGSFDGVVELRGAVVDPANGLVPIEISLPAGKFLVGEMAEAAITTGEIKGYVVPHQAILVNDKGDPYVVQAVKMAAKKVPVKVLASNGDEDVIDGKLDAAAPLVLAGNYQLDNGTKLRVADAKGDDSKDKADK